MKSASSIGEALAEIYDALPLPRVESVPLASAAGRIVATDIVADHDYWPFARAAMDGIAVRAADVRDATPMRPIRLAVSGAIYCGDAPTNGPAPRTAVRIATGAPLPTDCDAVIEQEVVAFSDGFVEIRRPVPAGNHVFPAGEDVRANERVIRIGTRLRGAQIGLLAVLGYAAVLVYRAPRIALLACGDELVEPGTSLAPGHIVDSNTYALAAEVRALGADPIRLGIVGDDPERLRGQLLGALEADAVVTCGGLSVGERDFVRPVLRAIGATFHFEGVPLKPGHPFSFATRGGRPIFALPGTPGACAIAFEVFVRPAIVRLMGARNGDRPHTFLRLEHDVATRPGRARFLWARVGCDDRGSTVAPLSGQGTASIRSASEAHALIELPANRAFASAGTEVETWLLDRAGESAPPGVLGMVAVVGGRNAGKTTLIERLIPVLARRGIRVGVVKHHGHLESLDVPGKDTTRFAAAGAVTTVLAGPLGSITRTAAAADPLPADLLAGMHGVDLVLLEGYAASPLPKLRVLRDGYASPRDVDRSTEIATVGDPASSPADAPHFAWNALEALADHVLAHLGMHADLPAREAALHAVC